LYKSSLVGYDLACLHIVNLSVTNSHVFTHSW